MATDDDPISKLRKEIDQVKAALAGDVDGAGAVYRYYAENLDVNENRTFLERKSVQFDEHLSLLLKQRCDRTYFFALSFCIVALVSTSTSLLITLSFAGNSRSTHNNWEHLLESLTGNFLTEDPNYLTETGHHETSNNASQPGL